MATDLTCTCTVLSAPAQVWPLGLLPRQGSERQTARTACILLCQQTSRCQMLKSRFPTPFPLETQNILGIRYSFIPFYSCIQGRLGQVVTIKWIFVNMGLFSVNLCIGTHLKILAIIMLLNISNVFASEEKYSSFNTDSHWPWHYEALFKPAV